VGDPAPFLARFTDSDAIYFPTGGFKLVELAPNVQHPGQGASHLIVNMKDGSWWLMPGRQQ
jgi:hypothetical protein